MHSELKRERTLALIFVVVFLGGARVALGAVYEAHPYAAGTAYEREWIFGKPGFQLGYSQFSQARDASGRIIIDAMSPERVARMNRYTRFYLGPWSWETRGSAASVAQIGRAHV